VGDEASSPEAPPLPPLPLLLPPLPPIGTLLAAEHAATSPSNAGTAIRRKSVIGAPHIMVRRDGGLDPAKKKAPGPSSGPGAILLSNARNGQAVIEQQR
jgi:hypothetical protein